MTMMIAGVNTDAKATPVEETPYGRSGLRLEIRPSPKEMLAHGPFARTEGQHTQAGITGRWISVVNPLSVPYYQSAFIPTNDPEAAGNDALFKEWVGFLHDNHIPVVSWYPLIFSKSGVATHPEWRQKFIIPEPAGHANGITVCFHTGYGEALINFCKEAIDRFGIDGFWFDGAAWTQIWDRPIPLSCVCDGCRKQFKHDTGLDLPSQVDWTSPVFRRWVAWRYDAFGKYIGRLAKGIRAKHPDAAVIINHYHRPQIPWQGAIPLNPYDADIITGSEATGQERVDLTMRLCVAYGRKQSEVWRPFNVGGEAQTNDLVHHALACITAGGMPSYGGDVQISPQAVATVKSVAEVIDALRPYVGGEPLKDVALHLSQQTETFHFSRSPKGVGWDLEPFWSSVESWTGNFGRTHRSPSYVFDRSLTRTGLKGYRLLLLPMSQALSEEQARLVTDFVRGGGTVLLGVGCGQLDEWGEPRRVNPLAQDFEFSFEGVPSPAAEEVEKSTLVAVKEGERIPVLALRTPVHLIGKAWSVLYRHGMIADAPPAIATRSFGKGHVLLTDTESHSIPAGWQAVAGGDTSIAVTEEKVRQGRHALKLVDAPNAPYGFCPDMEMNFGTFGLPRYPEGRFSCDLWLGPRADVAIELRQQGGEVRLGPSLRFANGKAFTPQGELGALAMERWVHVEITVHFAESTGASYDLSLRSEDGATKEYKGLPCINAKFSACNWVVLYGAGQETTTFYVDDLNIERITREGKRVVVLADDFESTPVGGVKPAPTIPALARALIKISEQLAPPLITVDGPDTVRVGAFRQADRIVVHLHNLEATHKNWKQAVGPAIALRIGFAVKQARLALSEENLPLSRENNRTVINVPHVGLHQVVILE